ncbi:Sjogren's syndrome/scleroderma autoantigen 1 family protein [Salinibaculum salinum]|uniref:Sjogren's syndrome/scleroderma autoantigen 1 family protein n=1 Tax=Salinibaculum salinum TaxID=3131996 RepID=UPI0030EB66F1
MSDFDKEAERERLREKYEQEQKEREATEKMSELLLQGATMTNAHCSDCGDPIFRYDGQEFCASCEKAVDRDTGEGGESEDGEESESDQQGGENIEVATPDDARVAFGGENAQDDPAAADDQQSSQQSSSQASQPIDPTQSQQSGNEQEQPRQRSAEQEQPSQQSPQQRRPDASVTSQQPSRQPERTREVPSVEPGGTSDVSAARASLVRTLTRFSEQAEATDDPQRAREYLAAAREAAETLAALRQ